MTSPEREALIEQVRPLLETEDQFHIHSGLDVWFVPEGAKAQLPVCWKQALITWSAIYPLAMLTHLAVVPLLRVLGLPALPKVQPAPR